MTEFELLLACYRSGQVSERQWQEHLRDQAFREWVEDQQGGRREVTMAGLTIEVDCDDGAFMTIADPRSFEDGGVGWRLLYGNPERVRYAAAALVESYDYLLSGEITQKEAERRLRLMRQVRRAILEQGS